MTSLVFEFQRPAVSFFLENLLSSVNLPVPLVLTRRFSFELSSLFRLDLPSAFSSWSWISSRSGAGWVAASDSLRRL
jgi:hypothetical protein